MKLTRREFAGALAVAPTLGGQTPAGPASAEPLRAAEAKVRRDGQALAAYPAPLTVEPAFTFKA
jgi:hypothetical protein